MRTGFRALFLGVMVATASACGAQPGASSDLAGSDDRAALAESDVLTIGSTGPAVRAVNLYLTEYGYLPNAELQRRYPQWRSPVETAPASDDGYDSSTAEGVLVLQRAFQLEETGVVDAATRDVLVQARCGIPELDPSDDSTKYDIYDDQLFDRKERTWRLLTPNDCRVSKDEAESALTAAFAAWAGPSLFTFTKIDSGTADHEIRCTSKNSLGNDWPAATLAEAYFPVDGGDIWINRNISWSVTLPVPAGSYDFQSNATHEIGHTLGLRHSSVTTSASMYPSINAGATRRPLHADDRVAAMATDISWYRFDSESYDIDVNSEGLFTKITVTGDPAIAGGYTVWRRSSDGSWITFPGQGGVRVSSDDDVLWIVQDDGDIYEWQTDHWTKQPGCAYDIAVGHDHSVWIVSCDTQFTSDGTAPTGYKVKKWDGTSFVTAVGGQGSWRISVGPAKPGASNVPWIVNQKGGTYRRTSSSTSSGTYDKLPDSATDIAVGPTGAAWKISKTSSSGGYTIYACNEQAALGVGSPNPRSQFRWRLVTGAATNISIDDKGTPFLVNNIKRAYWPE